jgi:hypothetical protein
MTRNTLLILAASFPCLLAPNARAQQRPAAAVAANDSTRMAAITYISGQSLYVGAGRADGVREGMSLDVLRRGVVIATVRATFLSSHSSSCEVVSSTAAPIVGDSVRYRPAFDRTTIAADDSVGTAAESRTRSPTWRRPIRGHVGLRYLSITQPNVVNSAAFTQPSVDLHVDGTDVGGTPISFVIDGRSRRTVGARATSASSLEQRTLVYEASMAIAHQTSGARLSVGRQYSAALSSVSLFDGLTAELNRSKWGVGLFGGVQPDVATMGYSTAIREAGGYVQVHNEPDGAVPWSVTTGAVDSRDLGQLNREFGFAQIAVNSRTVSVYATQEIDLNRGWKRVVGEPSVSPTSTFAMISIRPIDELSIQGGVDNRRNVRLYRDYVSPETEFDDAFRQGVWGGANLSIHQRIRIGGDARTNRGGAAGDAAYYTASLGLGPISRLRLDARGRSTSFKTARSAGWLHAWSVAADPLDIGRFEINGGLRAQRLAGGAGAATPPTAITALPNARWIGASIDVGIGRSWYVLASATRDGSRDDLTNQLYGSLVFRF